MTPTTSNIPVMSFNCGGCDCGRCGSDALSSIASLDGVVHVRANRRASTFTIRYDPDLVDESVLVDQIRSARLRPS